MGESQYYGWIKPFIWVACDDMRVGKHVLCEKPVALTLEDWKEMVWIADETRNRLISDYNFYFSLLQVGRKADPPQCYRKKTGGGQYDKR